MVIELTKQIARNASIDAGNKNMRNNGRTKWNENDYNVASQTYYQFLEIRRESPPFDYAV